MRGGPVEVAPAPLARPPLTQPPLTQDPLAQPPVARNPAHSGPARPASAVGPAPAVRVLPPVAGPSRPAPWSADVPPPWPPSASGSGGPPPSAPPSFGGLPTGELEVYGLNRRDVQRGSARRDAALAEVGDGGSGRGGALRAGVERWSRWAAGLGRPPRDPSGTRRYPGLEGLFPPAVWLTAALGAAVVVGLVSGIVVTGG